MKHISKIGMFVVASAMLAATSCSDYSDYNSVPEDGLMSANSSLMQNIAENEQLSDFAAIITKAGYSDILSRPNFYTLWAPLNGTYDAQSVLAQDSATIARQFVMQHIANFGHLVSGNVKERIISLNEKHHEFTNDKYDDVSIVTANIPSSNGVIHTIDGASMFYPNLYEELDVVEGCNSFKQYLQSYDETYLDVTNSVVGPVVNGQQTYLDSVFKKRNRVITSIMRAELENEDSSYTMLYPTDKAWEEAYNTINADYNYISDFYYMDMSKNATAAASIQATTAKSDKPITIDKQLYTDSLTKRKIVEGLVFSNTYERNKPIWSGNLSTDNPDTLITTNKNYISNLQFIYDNTVGEVKQNSNGYSRIVDAFPYYSWESYEPMHLYTRPVRTLGYKNSPYATHTIAKSQLIARDTLFYNIPSFIKKDLLSDTQYFSYVSIDKDNFSANSAKTEMDFALNNALSTKYHIYIVTIPAQLNEPQETALKPYYLRCDLSYTDAAGTQRFQRLNVEGAKLTDDIITEPGKINVIHLEFTLPICYYGLEAYPTLFISQTKNFTTTANRNKYDQELRIAGVYLVPEQARQYYENLSE